MAIDTDELGRPRAAMPIRIVAGNVATDETGRPVPVTPIRYVAGPIDTALGAPVPVVPVEEVAGLVTTDEAGRAVPVRPVRVVTEAYVADLMGGRVASLAVRAVGGGAPEAIGGIEVGTAGATGTLYEGFKLIAGDDFNAAPSRWSGRNLTGKYAHSALSVGFRRTNTADSAMYIDPSFRGVRSQSPADLGIDRVSVSGSVLTLTASAPEAEVLPLLPTTWTGGVGDGSNRPRLLSGSLKTAPHFMLSAQANWVAEARVRVPAGIARGYWPSFWTSTFFWPDRGEADIIEVRKNPDGSVRNLAVMHGNSVDGGPNNIVEVSNTAWPANTWINAMARRIGNTVFFYDDANSPGTYVLRGSNSVNITRFSGAHDIRLDLAVSNAWDSSTFNAGDWPKSVEFDWWRVWVPTAAGPNRPTQILPAVNTTPGGSWAATFPSAVDLHGSGAGLEQVTGAFDNYDAPGFPTRNTTTRLPSSMTVNLSTRTVSGTVPTTEGGCLPILITYAYDDGTPASRVMLPFNVAPAVQSVFANQNVGAGDAVSLAVAYTDFHSGNLGPHTFTASSDKPWLTITGNGTQALTITGTALANDVATITINCTNAIGQTTTVTRTVTASAAPASYTTWSGPIWYDASDAATLTLSGSVVTAVANKRAGGGGLVAGGVSTGNITRAVAAQNGLDAIRLVRDATPNAPFLAAAAAAPASTMWRGADTPYTVLVAFKPTDANTGFIFSAGEATTSTVDGVSFVRRAATPSSVRKVTAGTANDVNVGTGQAANVARIVAIRHTGTTVSIWDNSTTAAVTDAAQDVAADMDSNTRFRLFASLGGGSADAIAGTQCNMDFFEIVAVNGVQSVADIQQAITDMAAKWGITLS